MSKKMTVIGLPGLRHGTGLQDWGELTAGDMIKQYRDHARYELEWAQQVLAAKDEDFRITVVRGPWAQHHIRTLQEGAGAPSSYHPKQVLKT